MENLGGSIFPGDEDLDKPIPLDDDADKPIPLDDEDTGGATVSHSPLSLGGSSPAPVAKPAPATKPAPVAKPAAKEEAGLIASSNRITGVKTFFTKLHPGALQFLDEQINNWLKNNPGIEIKRTDTTTGEVQAKKTEPNIIITVWY